MAQGTKFLNAIRNCMRKVKLKYQHVFGVNTRSWQPYLKPTSTWMLFQQRPWLLPTIDIVQCLYPPAWSPRLHHHSCFHPPESSSSSWWGHCQILGHWFVDQPVILSLCVNLRSPLSINKSVCIALMLALRVSVVFFSTSSISKLLLQHTCACCCHSQIKGQLDMTLWYFYTATVISFYVSVIYHVYFQIWLSLTCIYTKYMLIWNWAFWNVIKLLCLWHHRIAISYKYNRDWVWYLCYYRSPRWWNWGHALAPSRSHIYTHPTCTNFYLTGLLLHEVGYYFILMIPHRLGITAIIINTLTTNYNMVYLRKVGAYSVRLISIWWQSQYIPANRSSPPRRWIGSSLYIYPYMSSGHVGVIHGVGWCKTIWWFISVQSNHKNGGRGEVKVIRAARLKHTPWVIQREVSGIGISSRTVWFM